MEKPLRLTLLYTANIAGDLDLLPRLHTFLQRLKPAGSRATLLLDLGRSCSESVWHCRDTSGRSALIVLDGMGYHAAIVDEAMNSEVRDKLAAQVTLAPIDGQTHWRYRMMPGIEVIVATRPAFADAFLQIMLEPAESTRLDGKLLRLQAVGHAQVGQVDIDMLKRPLIASASIHDMPSGTQPNPSIAGAVDFVLSEARYHQRRQT